MQCSLIYGDSGKTMLLEKFIREHTPSFENEQGVAKIPVIVLQMPPAPDEKRFYSQMLAAVEAPSLPDERRHRLEGKTLRLFNNRP